jgi:hypothetical protein
MQHLTTAAKSLEEQIAAATPCARRTLQPKLERVLGQFRDSGLKAPRRLVRLNSALIDEVVEARFDNMPV